MSNKKTFLSTLMLNSIIDNGLSDLQYPTYNRDSKLEFNILPDSESEFYKIIDSAPIDILEGMGFKVWQSMNQLISDNNEKRLIEPSIFKYEINGKLETLLINEVKEIQETYLENDIYVILFPIEWLNVIPEGFECIDIYGERFEYKKEFQEDVKNTKDFRYGCLPFGITRPSNGEYE